jgi:hypothetical protein
MKSIGYHLWAGVRAYNTGNNKENSLGLLSLLLCYTGEWRAHLRSIWNLCDVQVQQHVTPFVDVEPDFHSPTKTILGEMV